MSHACKPVAKHLLKAPFGSIILLNCCAISWLTTKSSRRNIFHKVTDQTMNNSHNSELELLLENQSLRFEFALRKLDLEAVFCPTPDDLTRENRVLRHLLDWVETYTECRDRTLMELNGYDFPPISLGISPEEDWYRFKEWIHGNPLRMKLKEQLLVDYLPKDPKQLTDDDISAELEQLVGHLAKVNVQVDLQGELPPRLLYEHLLEILEEDFDILVSGMWHLDGCDGYCPGCFQRLWCDIGQNLCWQEDEEAGKMALIDLLQTHVSATPISLSLLRERQAEEDRLFAKFKQNQDDDEMPF